MENKKTGKRVRRTKKCLEQDLYNSAISVIGQVGFSGLTVTQLLKEANADPTVFYNRYTDINDFIDKFVRSYDYWLNDSINIDLKNGVAIDNIEKILVDLVDLLYENVCMQKLIAWEMCEDNFITRRTSQNRDNNSVQLIQYFEKEFEKCGINFNIATALVIGGVYYLVIHKDLATFNKIDFSKRESLELLKKNVSLIIRRIFEDYNGNNLVAQTSKKKDIIEIAKKLLQNGVSVDIIENSTGLSKSEIMSLNSVEE